MTTARRVEEIIVFAKYPEPGRVKTRLAAGLGAEGALQVYKALLSHTLAVVQSTPFTTVLAVDPPERLADAPLWAPGMDLYMAQCAGDLGARMENAVQQRLDAGAERVLLLGCDCPQISKDSVVSSMTGLETHDVILGPTEDGGYYLLGLKGRHPFLFRDIPWSTEEVLGKTLNILKNHTLSYLLRDLFMDVDTLEDFNRVRHLEPLKRLGTG